MWTSSSSIFTLEYHNGFLLPFPSMRLTYSTYSRSPWVNELDDLCQCINTHAISCKEHSCGIQLSFHALVMPPSPILLISACFSTETASWIFRQIWDGLLPISAPRRCPWGSYLALKILALSKSGLCRILHPCFAKSARTKSYISWKPKPLAAHLAHIFPWNPCRFVLSFFCHPTKFFEA